MDIVPRQDAAPQVDLATRRIYRPSGRVRYARLLVAVLPLSVILAVISSGLAWLSLEGWYFVVLAPLFAGICLVPFVVVTMKWAHCRSQNVGLAFGLFFGAALYIGNFHAMLVMTNGWHALPRVVANSKGSGSFKEA